MLINNTSNVLFCYSGGARSSCRAGVVQFKSIKYRIIRIITDYENHSSPKFVHLSKIYFCTGGFGKKRKRYILLVLK